MQKIGTRNIVLGIIAIGIITATFVFKSDSDTAHIFNGQPQQDLVSEAVRKNRNTDSDNDTVPDWKEVLAGTDPHNPNTFSTEGGDAAYIAAQHTAANQGSTATSTEGYGTLDTLTEKIARGTFGEYLLVRSGEHGTGYASPSDLASAITEQTLDEIKPPVYTKNDFTVVFTDRAALLAYADGLNEIDKKYPDSAFANTSATLNQAFTAFDEETGGSADVQTTLLEQRITPILKLYDGVLKELTTMKVPELLINEHINLTNSVRGVRWSLAQTMEANTDPTKALIGIQLFPEYVTVFETSYGAIERKLTIEDIPL